MKNPLNKRILRDLRSEFSKYLVIFILMVVTIGFGSGFLIAADSLLAAYNGSFTKYNVEYGHFSTKKKMNRGQRKSAEELGISLYDLTYAEETVTPGTYLYGTDKTSEDATADGLQASTLRMYKNRTEVDKVCLMEGDLPAQSGEIAIDRMYASNNKISVGDTISSGSHTWTVTGLVALSDYSSLFQNNGDTMFDAIKFGVAIVSDEEFDTFPTEELTWNYAWLYDDTPADETAENDAATDLCDELTDIVSLTSFVPRYTNQAIQFTGEDFGSDKGMMIVIIYMVIVIIAFVFGLTASSTIQKESSVIGTLRASGYTRGELILHYMTAPMIVTAISALLGNLLGYTFLKDTVAALYYNSYSLPTFETLWNAYAFVLTTVIPLILMVVVNFTMLARALYLPPLAFLRRDLSRKKRSRAFPLNEHLPFMMRYRLRVIFQNIPNYILLFVGILFANLLLFFGLMLPDLLDNYQANITNNLISNYQYILTIPEGAIDDDNKLESLFAMMRFEMAVDTENETAEKFSAYSLETLGDYCPAEEITVYGVSPDSRFISLDPDVDGVTISSLYADKYQLSVGDTITLKESYKSDTYTFTVGAIYDYEGGQCIFMDQTELNRTFDMDDDMFSGYFSDTPITDIDQSYIGTTIDIDSLTKVCRQLNTSMGSLMYLFDGFAVLIFLVLMYVMSKVIIEKNAQSISMAKILGYSTGEIGKLYIVSTTLVIIVSILISFPLESALMEVIYRWAILEYMTGWLPLSYSANIIFPEMFLLGLGSYAVVAVLELRRIRKVPMDQALKNAE